MTSDKKQLYHKLRGSRRLDDARAEAVAYLLSNPKTEGDIATVYPELTPDDLEAMKSEELFQRRLAFLKDAANKKRKSPKTLDQYEKYALRRLHRICESAKDEKIVVMAADCLGSLASKLKKAEPEKAAGPVIDIDALSQAYTPENE